MLKKPVITLTTDFSSKDPFGGIMKGVMLRINPSAEIVDITHNISPQNVFEASLILSMSYRYFPRESIHVAVVDPGVGGPRKPILVAADEYYFIGPDNGIFSPVFAHSKLYRAYHIANPEWCLPSKGPTFHGRDIFAPAAAWLSKGIAPERFGDPVNNCVKLSLPSVTVTAGREVSGEVIYLDSFGNAITNITKKHLSALSKDGSLNSVICTYGERVLGLSANYEEKKGLGLSAIVNSFEFLELFVYKGSASETFGIKEGDKVSASVVK